MITAKLYEKSGCTVLKPDLNHRLCCDVVLRADTLNLTDFYWNSKLRRRTQGATASGR